MATNIFESGNVYKKEVYQLVKTKLTEAGWTNVTSNPNTDGDVFISQGEKGNKNLIINIKPGNDGSSVETTNSTTCQCRLQTYYNPGPTGTAGTFGRPTLGWGNWNICPLGSVENIQFEYKILADKNRFILALIYPPIINQNPTLVYVGEPLTLYNEEGDNTGTIFASTINNPYAQQLYINNKTPNIGTVTTPYNLITYSTIAPKNPNASGNYTIAEILYGDGTEG
ncbi:MAG: hypothetical protein LBR56_03320, partial [Sporomusaceae bacterium]|nr:hypothetical protein [Sporomusaceae bacterium]